MNMMSQRHLITVAINNNDNMSEPSCPQIYYVNETGIFETKTRTLETETIKKRGLETQTLTSLANSSD